MLGLFILAVLFTCTFACVYEAVCLLVTRTHMLTLKKRSLDFEDILCDQPLCFLLFAAVSLVVSYATSIWIAPLCLVISWVLSKRAPHIIEERKRKELRSACDEQADVMADIIAMGVGSGLSFDAAIELYCSKFDNDLSTHMQEASLQWSSGLASREQALKDMANHIDSKALRRFSETSLQAIHHGSPLADMLERFSNDIRRQRKCAIERQIEKAPVKMLIPTGICILPAMLILVMGPVVLQFLSSSF